MPEGLSNLPRVLRQWRKEQGIKQAVAASAVGVSSATWGHWEVGIRFPSAENLLALSQYTKIPIQYFFRSDAEQYPLNWSKS
jgi:transcriptional regulator with XRE-family HTH domain